MTKQELQDRIVELEDEINTLEDENHWLEMENLTVKIIKKELEDAESNLKEFKQKYLPQD